MKIFNSNLYGSEIINLLERGHVVRRACWVEGFYIRICNEHGFDDDGIAVFDDRVDHIYTHATNGYFMHLGSSHQPFSKPRLYWGARREWKHASRQGEGLNALFGDDWEDYGFMESDKFNELTNFTQSLVRKRVTDTIAGAIKEANREYPEGPNSKRVQSESD